MIYKPKDIFVENIILKKNIYCGNNIYTNPIKYLGSNGFCRFNAVCILTTPPTKNDMNNTIPIEFNPIFVNSNTNCFLNALHFSGIVITFFIIMK